MKKYIILLAIINYLSANSYAQWNDFGGNNLAGGEYLGANALSTFPLELKTVPTGVNALPINFYTSNTFRMILDPTGNLGIGTLTPAQPLDVNGPIAIGGTTALRVFPFSGGTMGTQTLVGWGAGVSMTGGRDNTFVGNNAGFSNVGTSGNTFLGCEAGYAHIGNGGNIFLGYYAGHNAISTAEGVFIGSRAGEVNDGSSNVIIGVSAGQWSYDGDNNVFIGNKSGYSTGISGNSSVGNQNVFIGQQSGELNTTGNFNTFLGAESGQNAEAEHNLFMGYRTGRATTRNNNVFGGYLSGEKNTTGANNVFLGSNSGNTNLTGSENTFLGTNAGFANSDDIGNTFVGYESGNAFNAGTHNVYVGHSAGLTPTIGDINTLIGYNTHHDDAVENSTALGANADVVTSNNMILGDNAVNVGIGLSGIIGGPLAKLHIQGTSGAQFRISYDYTAPIHTDFETTSSGYLKVNPTAHFTGFDLSGAPANVVDVNSSSTSTSGLKLRNLTNVTTPGSGKVLSLDANNNVILVYDQTGNASVCGTNNIMARFTGGGVVFDCSDIYNDFTNSKIGMFTTSPSYNMHVLKPSMFSDVSGLWNLTYSPTTPHQYTLGIGCDIANNYHTGLGFFSSNSNSSTDRMQMYADEFGIGILRTFYVPYVIMNKENVAYLDGDISNPWIATSTLGTVPERAGIVIANDFYDKAATNLSSLVNYNAKLWVESNDMIIPGAGNSGITPIHALNSNSVNMTAVPLCGIESYCNGIRHTTGTAYTYNFGGDFFAGGADINQAIHSYATSTSALTNVGGQFKAEGASFINYGVRSYAPIVTCSATSCADAAGYFSGWVYNTGNYVPSDASLKTNIQPLQLDNTILRNLPIYSYNFLTNNNFGMPLPDGNHYGVMASELQAVLPDMVRTFINPEEKDTAGNIISQEKIFDAVNYTELVPLLIAGYQQQANKLDSLTDALAALQATVNNCCNIILPRNSNNAGNDEAMSVELENVKAIVLNQNEPNPFAEQTIITWTIPADNSTPLNAMLMFYDNTGSILKTVKINEAGPGRLLVYGSKLSQGIYTYSLVVNNKTIDRKKMVKSK